MHIFSSTTLMAALICLASVASAAPIQCERTKLSTTGFGSVKTAASWYPERIWFEINGVEVKGLFGEGTVAQDGNRQLITFNTTPNKLRVRYFPQRNIAQAWVLTRPGFVSTTPSLYACK